MPPPDDRATTLPHRPLAAAELADRLADDARRRGRRRPPTGRYVRVEGRSTRAARSIATGWRGCPASRRRTGRWSASTPRRPAWRPPPGPSPSSSGSAGGTDRPFRQVQLLLPDHGQEPALLDALAAHIPRRRLARDLQRPRLRLAAARHPLPDGPPGRARPRRPPRPAAGRPPRLPPPDGRRPAADRRADPARPGPPRRRRRLGDPRPLPRVPARRTGPAARGGRPPQRRGRPLAGPAHRPARRRLRHGRGTPDARRSGTWPAWPGRSSGRDGPTRRSPASTRSSTAPAADARSRARPSPARPSRRSPAPGPDRAVVVAAGPAGLRRTAAPRPTRTVALAPDRGRSPPPGIASGSRSTGRTCSAGSGATPRRRTPGRRSPPARVAARSSPGSSWPSSASTGCGDPDGALRRDRRRPGGASTDGDAWGCPSRALEADLVGGVGAAWRRRISRRRSARRVERARPGSPRSARSPDGPAPGARGP